MNVDGSPTVPATDWLARVSLRSGSTGMVVVESARSRLALSRVSVHNGHRMMMVKSGSAGWTPARPTALADQADEALRRFELGDASWLEYELDCEALLALDAKLEVLHCRRGPTGLGALFWRRDGDTVWVSACPSTLARAGRRRAPVDPAAIADHLRSRWHDPEETCLDGVRRVPPGHVSQVSHAGHESTRYWHPAKHGTSRDGFGADGFSDALGASVETHLRNGSPAILLSGGIDSVSIAVSIESRTRSSTRPRALSLGFSEASVDERELQRAVSSALEFPLDLLELGDAVAPRGLVGSAVDLSASWPLPLQNVWLPAFIRLARRGKASGAGVLFTGHGGDEWLTIAPVFAADLMRDLRVLELAGFVSHARRSYATALPATLRHLLWTSGVRPNLSRAGRRMLTRFSPATLDRRKQRRWARRTPPWLAPDRRLAATLDARVAEATDAPAVDGFYRQALDESLSHPVVSTDLEEYRELGLRSGTAMAHPYLDPDMVALAYRTPPEALYADGLSKSPARKLVRDRFPALGFDSQKKAFASRVFLDAMRAEGKSLRDELGDFEALADLGVVDPTRVPFIANGPADPRGPAAAMALWLLLSTESWIRQHV